MCAPDGRDAEVAISLLRESGIAAVAISDLASVVAFVNDGTAFVILTEEAAQAGDLRALSAWLLDQPAWSDLPFIILTRRGGGPERNPSAARLSDILGNVTFLERPFHVTTFVSVARSALKGRRRQFEARARLDEISRLNTTLEERVAQRTEELQKAHSVLVEEVAQREKAEEQLRQSQKLEAIGQLTGGVAHDFNNLLMAVLGSLELLSKHLVNDPKASRLLDGATRGARRGAALTQRLLAFGRRQDLTIKAVDLSELVNGMDDLLARSIGSNIRIEKQLPSGLPMAMADVNQIELALLNLAINARDAMPEGGTLSIYVREEILAKSSKELERGSYLVLGISDTGCGMNKDTLDRAIEPFFSTKELGKGTGLGLSMIHGLALQLRGMLKLTSTPGLGTTAELWLPATARVVENVQVQAPPVTPDRTTQLRILMVDDDALIAMSSVDMLEDLGHVVTEANSGAAALALLEAGHKFDLMITDFSMPGMNGAELGLAARKLHPKLPILVASGYAELPPGSGSDLPRLAKPYSQSQLATEIAKLFVNVG